MSNIYIASSTENRTLLPTFATQLVRGINLIIGEYGNAIAKSGYKIPRIAKLSSRWFQDDPVYSLKSRAKLDYSHIDQSLIMVAVYPYGYGTTSEMGYALGKKIPIIYFRESTFIEDDPLPAGKLAEVHTLCPAMNDSRNAPHKILQNLEETIDNTVTNKEGLICGARVQTFNHLLVLSAAYIHREYNVRSVSNR